MKAANIRHGVVLAVVLAAAALSAWLLWRTVDAADAIDERAQAIAESGRGINLATDSVMQLRRTNEIAGSILESARPLDQQLAQIVDLSRNIDGTAAAIGLPPLPGSEEGALGPPDEPEGADPDPGDRPDC